MLVSLTYLSHCIEIDLPDPEDSNVIYITLTQSDSTFDPKKETGFLASYQISAVADDPNCWLVEAVTSVVSGLAHRGRKFYSPPPKVPSLADPIDVSDVSF